MERQEFHDLAESGLLERVEQIVVEGHRTLSESQGLAWSPPLAYKWLRYEDPEPVKRLAEGAERLRERGVEFDADAVEKACAKASEKGFLN
ncbi:MAG: hypothetical protein ACYDAL_09130 [Candidatus Dormibacteraceae bacterium]